MLLRGREHINYTVNGTDSVSGMQGADDQVACPGGAQGGGNCGEIAHFPENDHVSVIPEGMNEGGIKGLGIITEVTLDDGVFFLRMEEFNGVLDRDHIPPIVFIKVIQRGCLSSRFAGATGSGNRD
jgi:hypothetical protein